MAPPPGTLRVSKYLGSLSFILVLLYLIVLLPGTANTPKLGIDLVGGVRVIFTAKPPPGEAVTSTSMQQARQIIEDRINGTGVTASTVQIQGDDQLVVSIPGGTGTNVDQLGQAAQLNFRPLVAPAVPVSCNPALKARSVTGASTAPSGSAAPSGATSGAKSSSTAPTTSATSGSNAPNGLDERPLAAPTPATTAATATPKTPAASSKAASTTPTGTATGSATGSGAASSAPTSASPSAAPACTKNVLSVLKKADPKLVLPTTAAEYAKLSQTQQQELSAAMANIDCKTIGESNLQADKPNSGYLLCDKDGSVAYLMGKVLVAGREIDEANAVAPSTGQGGSQQWTVSLTLKDSGKAKWAKWTTANNTGGSQSASPTSCGSSASGAAFPCADFVAFTLNGQVLTAPATNSAIVNTATQISGNFTQSSANDLADSLKYGALPLSFNTDSQERVSASLGTSQLKAALLAGGIGLALVVLYSLLYYRALGLVTIASLIVSGLLTYAMMVILGEQIGFTLDLSGIAGLIVALGITADSFVVFFERIKDEVHEGRSVRVAIPRAWIRARRTVLSADTVSFLAAAILYYFASADVKGFAFTLGLSTILDLVVVFLFTHPIVSLLARSRAFGSPRFTGLNSVRAGGITADRETAPRAKRAASTKRRATGTGTVVLDKTDTIEAEDDLEPVDDSDSADDVVADDTTPSTDEPRTRTTPSGGTAAERAAARRARQRKQQDEGTDS